MKSWTLAVVALGALASCSPRELPPTIVLISIDTLRADHVGAWGYPRDTTPTLDRLANESLVFERAYASYDWTLVSHMTMLTGLLPHQHGVLRGLQALAPGTPLLAEHLRAAGYHTVGLYHDGWINARHGFDRGFEVFREHENVEEARTHWREALAEAPAGRPLFLFLHLFDVHSEGVFPYYPSPEPFQDFFLPDATARFAGMTAEQIWLAENLPPEQVEALIALYDGGIRHVDTRLGELFDDLRARQLLDESVVVVTSDHGEALHDRARVRGHGGVRREGLHVPLIVHLPGGERGGERVAEPVSLVDLVPTLLELAGIRRDAALPGLSLLGELPARRAFLGGKWDVRFVHEGPTMTVKVPRGGVFSFQFDAPPGQQEPRRVDPEAFEALWSSLLPRTAFPSPIELDDLPAEDAAALRAMGYGGELDEH
jgi:arylsulfatase A-like enzyme